MSAKNSSKRIFLWCSKGITGKSWLSGASFGCPHIVHLTSHFMFTYSATRTSAAAQFVHVDLLRGVAIVSFKNGNMYEYKNVSRRAIASLMANPNMSLGFWINHNLLDTTRTSYKVLPDYATA